MVIRSRLTGRQRLPAGDKQAAEAAGSELQRQRIAGLEQGGAGIADQQPMQNFQARSWQK